MPAIAGIVYPKLFEVGQQLQPMLSIMRHRGAEPRSGYGYHELQIGCTGTELISNDRHSIWVCIDGKIHKRAQLIKELKAHGYRIGSEAADAELIVRAYGLWGVDFCQHIEGHYAIAVFDQRREQLYLFRDRIGCKPMYWSQENDHVLFASELKAILCTGIVPQVPDRAAQGDYFLLGYTPQDVTAVRGINRLLPGHYLSISLKGCCSVHRYWDNSSAFAPSELSWQEQADLSVQSSLENAFSDGGQLACVVGTGVGSEQLRRSLSTHHQGTLHQYEEHFLGLQDQQSCGPQQICITGASLLDDLVSFVWHMDEPIADIRLVAHWRLVKRAKEQGITQLVTSSAYDELFSALNPRGSYPQRLRWFSLFTRIPSSILSKVLLPLLDFFSPRAAGRFLRHRVSDPSTVADLKQQAMFTERSLRLAAPSLTRVTDWDLLAQSFFHERLTDDPKLQQLYNQLRCRLPDTELAAWDRACLSHGLDWKAPFATPELLGLLSKSPRFGQTAEHSTHPLSYPWVREPEIRRTLRLLTQGTLAGSGLLEPRYILQTIKKAHNNPFYTYPLWGLLILEIWNRLFIHKPVSTTPPKINVDDFLRTQC